MRCDFSVFVQPNIGYRSVIPFTSLVQKVGKVEFEDKINRQITISSELVQVYACDAL